MTRHHAVNAALRALALALALAALCVLAAGCYTAYSALTQPGCDDIGAFTICYWPPASAAAPTPATGAYGGYVYGPAGRIP